jgi:hypothetical protein
VYCDVVGDGVGRNVHRLNNKIRAKDHDDNGAVVGAVNGWASRSTEIDGKYQLSLSATVLVEAALRLVCYSQRTWS